MASNRTFAATNAWGEREEFSSFRAAKGFLNESLSSPITESDLVDRFTEDDVVFRDFGNKGLISSARSSND